MARPQLQRRWLYNLGKSMKIMKQKIKEILDKQIVGDLRYPGDIEDLVNQILQAVEEDKKEYDAGPCYRCHQWPCNCKEEPLMENKSAEQQVLDEIREWKRPYYPKGYKNRYSYLRDKIKSWQKRLKKNE